MKRDCGWNGISPEKGTPHVQALWTKLLYQTWILTSELDFAKVQHSVRKFQAELLYREATQEAKLTKSIRHLERAHIIVLVGFVCLGFFLSVGWLFWFCLALGFVCVGFCCSCFVLGFLWLAGCVFVAVVFGWFLVFCFLFFFH